MEFINQIKKYILSNKKIIIIITLYILTIISFIVGLLIIYNLNNNKIQSLKNENKLISYEEKEENVLVQEEKVYVDIKGAVKNPGVYSIEKNKRVDDVVNLAGGLIKDANTRYVNLSKTIFDEMVIIIYTNDEVKEIQDSIEELPCICEETVNDSCIEKINLTEESNNENKINDLININEATLEKLMELQGIGEVKAQSIIDYRNSSGNFSTIEDLMKVNGISESTYSKIKNFITI